MKKCNMCGETKCYSSYTKRNDTKKISYTHICKDCNRNKLKHNRTELKKYCVDLMGGSCSICGYNKNIAALEFHHNSDKSFLITNKFNKLCESNREKIHNELKKCILVCSNCHREIHNQ